MQPEKNKRTTDLQLAFDKNLSLIFLYKKSEKLATAIYMITSFIKDEDQVKWQLRKKSLELMSDMMVAAHRQPFEKGHGRKIAGHFTEIVSLFEIAALSGVISTMNFTIIRDELFALLSVIEKEIADPASQSLILSSDFFDVSSKEDSSQSASPVQPQITRTSLSEQRAQSIQRPAQQDVLDKGQRVSFTNQAANSAPKKYSTHPVVRTEDQDHSSDRRSVIVKLLMTKNEIGITDLSGLIKGCSDKTIQRELLAMVKEGVLEKHGERRWSRYTLLKV